MIRSLVSAAMHAFMVVSPHFLEKHIYTTFFSANVEARVPRQYIVLVLA